MNTVNIKIKSFGLDTARPHVATSKFMLRDAIATSNGCRWLEPGEVVAVPKDEALKLLALGKNYIEITLDEPNRPLCFRTAAEAVATSAFNPRHPGRAEKAKQKMAEVFAEMEAQETPRIPDSIDDLSIEDLEKMIADKKVEQASTPSALEAKLTEELADYVPTDNAVSTAEIEEVREKAKAEAEAEAEADAPKKITPARTRRKRA